MNSKIETRAIQVFVISILLTFILLILLVATDSATAKSIPPCNPSSVTFWACYRTQMGAAKPMTPTPPPLPVIKPYPSPEE